MNWFWRKLDCCLQNRYPKTWMLIHRPLFRYFPADPTEKIVRHYSFCRRVNYLTMSLGVLLVSNMALLQIFGPSTSGLILMGVGAFGGLFFILLNTCLMPLMADAEKELTRRGIQIKKGENMAALSQRFAMQMMGWTALAIAASYVLHRYGN